MELLNVSGIPVNGMTVSTKVIVNGAKRLLDDVVSLLEVFDEFVVLIQQLTHQGPVLLGLPFETIPLNRPLVNDA